MGVQLALLAGCHVVAVCGSAAKAERLRDLGASRIINYREEVRDRLTAQRRDVTCKYPTPVNKAGREHITCTHSTVLDGF